MDSTNEANLRSVTVSVTTNELVTLVNSNTPRTHTYLEEVVGVGE